MVPLLGDRKMNDTYDDALAWCRDALLFDQVHYEGTAGEIILTRLAEECCKALDGYDDMYTIPDAFFDAAEEAAREDDAVVEAREDEYKDWEPKQPTPHDPYGRRC
jgi:hypothetical protein